MKTVGEEWRDVVGYEGLYQVSNLGRVRSLDRVCRSHGNATMKKRGRILSQRTRKPYPYKVVALCVDRKMRHFLVHRLVAFAFLPVINGEHLQIDHINGDHSDNRVENLRWCTCQENNMNPITRKRKSQNCPRMTGERNPAHRPVRNVETGEVYVTTKLAAEAVGVCSNSIRQAIRHNYYSGGYHWEFVGAECENSRL